MTSGQETERVNSYNPGARMGCMGWKSPLACGPRVGQSIWRSPRGQKTLILCECTEWEQSPSEAEQLLPSEKWF